MRAYYIPAAAGVLLIVSAFVPWMHVGDVSLGGVPDTAGLWILGLGGLAVLLAGLSIWTRKNSRHPLLLVGLAAFAIMFLGYRWMLRTVRDAAWAQAQAQAIVNDVPAGAAPQTAIGLGIYRHRRRDSARAVRPHHRRQARAAGVRDVRRRRYLK